MKGFSTINIWFLSLIRYIKGKHRILEILPNPYENSLFAEMKPQDLKKYLLEPYSK